MESTPAPVNGPSAQFPHAPPPPCQASNNGSTVAVVSPCAACKILRRRCVDKCLLAPYFPPTEPYKFTIAHRVFGAANIIKFLQELPESQRADAVSSMVYEANARLRDPVYGSAGAICRLQEQISELQAELAKTQAEAVSVRSQNSNLVSLVCMEMGKIHGAAAGGDPTHNCNNVALQQQHQQYYQSVVETTSCSSDDGGLGSGWETFWG